jgi:hypothetical protein
MANTYEVYMNQLIENEITQENYKYRIEELFRQLQFYENQFPDNFENLDTQSQLIIAATHWALK